MFEQAHQNAVISRSALLLRERVSGRILLSSMWRVTPLDVATLKLKARQAELDDKQEIIAVLQDRCDSRPGVHLGGC